MRNEAEEGRETADKWLPCPSGQTEHGLLSVPVSGKNESSSFFCASDPDRQNIQTEKILAADFLRRTEDHPDPDVLRRILRLCGLKPLGRIKRNAVNLIIS